MGDYAYDTLVKGGYGLYNFGDDMLLLTLHAMLESCSLTSDIAYLCKNSSYLKKLIPNISIASHTDRDFIKTNRLVYGGGTQFYDFSKADTITTCGRILRILAKNKFLYEQLRTVYRWTKNRIKFDVDQANTITALGIGIGPLRSDSMHYNSTRKLFKKMDFVATRDEISQKFCDEWGLVNAELFNDICYWEPFYSSVITPMKAKRHVEKIAIVVRDWPHNERGMSYYDSILRVFNLLLKRGYKPTFCLFKGDKEPYWVQKFKAADIKYLTWNPDKQTVSFFCDQLAEFDLFISARFHGAVFATLLERPVICIDIEPKLSLASKSLGTSNLIWKYPFKDYECLSLIDEVNENYKTYLDNAVTVKVQQTKTAYKMVNTFKLKL